MLEHALSPVFHSQILNRFSRTIWHLGLSIISGFGLNLVVSWSFNNCKHRILMLLFFQVLWILKSSPWRIYCSLLTESDCIFEASAVDTVILQLLIEGTASLLWLCRPFAFSSLVDGIWWTNSIDSFSTFRSPSLTCWLTLMHLWITNV